jgi:hypothetical protein
MRTLILFLFAAALYGQTALTTVTATFKDSRGRALSGSISITPDSWFDVDEWRIVGTTARVPIPSTGLFSVSLVPTDDEGRYYNIRYEIGGAKWTGTWRVPASETALTITDVEADAPPAAPPHGFTDWKLIAEPDAPAAGNIRVYAKTGSGICWKDSANTEICAGAGGGGTWGSITGTLSEQTDLQSALDAKAPSTKGVTNGDSHDHSGGDGAQVAYAGLSGIPATFTPSTHAAAHAAGQADQITPAAIGAETALGFTPENAANKGASGGYAGLDSGGKVPAAQLPVVTAVGNPGSDTNVPTEQAVREMVAALPATGDDLGDATAGDVAALFSGAGEYLKKDGSSGTPAGAGDMAAATYDPANKAAQVLVVSDADTAATADKIVKRDASGGIAVTSIQVGSGSDPTRFGMVSGAAPAAPEGSQTATLYQDSADDHVKYKLQDGSVVDLTAAGAGDVVGPPASTGNAIPIFDGESGKVLKNGLCTQDVNGKLTCPGGFTSGGGTAASGIVLPELEANGSNDFRIYGHTTQEQDGCIALRGPVASGEILKATEDTLTIDGKTCRVMTAGADATGSSGDEPTAISGSGGGYFFPFGAVVGDDESYSFAYAGPKPIIHQFTILAKATISKIRFRVVTGGTFAIRFALWNSNADGTVGSKIADSAVVQDVATGTNAVASIGPTTLASGTYFLSTISDNGSIAIRQTNTFWGGSPNARAMLNLTVPRIGACANNGSGSGASLANPVTCGAVDPDHSLLPPFVLFE